MTSSSATLEPTPIPYMQRTREYYLALGYDTPYRWAHNVSAPFQPLKKPLTKARGANQASPTLAMLPPGQTAGVARSSTTD